MPNKVEDTRARYAALNPGYEVIVHTTDAELHPDYRHNWEHYAPMPSMKSDLLRFSLLRKYGGWYFDIDCIPFVELDRVVAECGVDGQRLFITYKGGFRNGDILAASPAIPYWDMIHDYLARPRYPLNETTYGYLEYASRLFSHLLRGGCELNIGEYERFNYHKDFQPFILREDEVRAYNIPAQLSVLDKTGRFVTAYSKWLLAGSPVRSEAEIAAIYKTHCGPCGFNVKGTCSLCGCRLEGLLNKILMATEVCPHTPPKW